MKNYRKRFKARKSLTPILVEILDKKFIEYHLEEGEKDDLYNYIHSDVSGMEYRRCVEDALCIEQQGDSPIPVLPYRILKNPKERRRVLKEKAEQVVRS